jgi:HEAT repeat protein
MYLYRGKDIGGRQELKETCLQIIRGGAHSEIYDILPHLRIVRSPEFLPPLLELLNDGNIDQKAAAAMALGSLGDGRAIEHLERAFRRPDVTGDHGSRALQAAIIQALGELGTEEAVHVIVDLFRFDPPSDHFKPQRTHLVIAALGQLAQQGVTAAEDELVQLMEDGSEIVRIQAVTELAIAFWHRPNEIPERLLNKIGNLATEDTPEVRMAARASLSNLVQLGSTQAEDLVRQWR